MIIHDVSIIPESSKIEIFKLAVKHVDRLSIEATYEKFLEIYCNCNQAFDKKHSMDRRIGLMFDMQDKEK
jgi:hypothetical protein